MSGVEELSDIKMAVAALRNRVSAKNDAELAKKLGVSKQTVSSWMARGSIPRRYLSMEPVDAHDWKSKMAIVPARPGFYWGRWHTPVPGTADDGEMCIGTEWAVHEVFRGGFDEGLRAFVPGVEKSQSLDAFEWGPEVVRHAAAS